jgi:hypothetical protein
MTQQIWTSNELKKNVKILTKHEIQMALNQYKHLVQKTFSIRPVEH